MEITEIEANKDQRAFSLLLPVAEIERKMRDRLQDLGQNYNRKGFRPGRVPLGVLRRDFGPAVFHEILQAELKETSQRALQDSHRRPIGQPRIEAEDELSPDKDCRFRMEVDVMPEIQGLEDLSWIKLERLVPNIRDEDVDKVLTDVAARVGEAVELGDDQQAEDGDVLVIDFDASLDGEKIDSAHAEGYQVELGSKQMMDGFEDQLIGLTAGDQKEFPITLPDDFGNAELAGKIVDFSVAVKTVSRREPWPIDDELAKKQNFETLPLFREDIREHLRRDADLNCHGFMRRNLLDQLYERYVFPAPKKLIDAEFATIRERIKNLVPGPADDSVDGGEVSVGNDSVDGGEVSVGNGSVDGGEVSVGNDSVDGGEVSVGNDSVDGGEVSVGNDSVDGGEVSVGNDSDDGGVSAAAQGGAAEPSGSVDGGDDDGVSAAVQGEAAEPSGDDDRTAKTGRMWDAYHKIATRRVCLALILSEIGYRNEINLSETDMRQAISRAVLSGGIDPKEAVTFLRENPTAVQEIYAPAYEEKVVDFLFELGKSGEKSITLDELAEMDSEQQRKDEENEVADFDG